MSDKSDENRKLRERDLYCWSKATELLLFERRIHEIDWDAVGDALEKSAEDNDAKPMKEAVEKLLTHLAIWNSSPQYRSPARLSEIESAKFQLDDTLARSPSLAGLLELQWNNLWARASFAATLTTGDPAAVHGLSACELLLVTNRNSELETESGIIGPLRVRVATNSGWDGDDSDEDHYAWCRAQAAAVRSREFHELDPLGVADEILSAGTSVRRAVIELLSRLLDKLMACQTGRRGRRLKTEISLNRARLRALLWENPSLALAPELVREARRLMTEGEADSVVSCESLTSQQSPWTLAQVLDEAFIIESDYAFTDAGGAS